MEATTAVRVTLQKDGAVYCLQPLRIRHMLAALLSDILYPRMDSAVLHTTPLSFPASFRHHRPYSQGSELLDDVYLLTPRPETSHEKKRKFPVGPRYMGSMRSPVAHAMSRPAILVNLHVR